MPLSQNNLAIHSPAYPPLQHYTSDARFSWASECRHLFSFRLMHIFWWPLFLFRHRRMSHSPLFKHCKALPGFAALWRSIQKGSFAYNCLFLGHTPFKRSSATLLADLTTLAIFFGDEYIDGVATTAGKPFILRQLKDSPGGHCLKKETNGNKVSLHFHFDLEQLLTPGLRQQVNPKYRVTYQRFHNLLMSLLQLINKQLGHLPLPIAEKTADKIAEACNSCFDTYLYDLNSCTDPVNLAKPSDVLRSHELKTAFTQIRLLELRCILSNKEEALTHIQTPGWVDIARVVQIYDDIDDAMIDHGYQNNLLLSVAAHHFPDEWEWFRRHMNQSAQQPPTALLFSLYMPCSMEYCLQMASNKIRTMNWEQQKIMHYLILKNKYTLYIGKGEDNRFVQRNFLSEFYRQIKGRMPHLPLTSVKSFAIDTCIHIPEVRKQLLGKLNLSTAYRLRYNILSLPQETKASIFDIATAQESL
jgi:hypothetical protein